MIPQIHAAPKPVPGGRGGGHGLPETGLAALSRPIAAHGMLPILTSMARVDRREKKIN